MVSDDATPARQAVEFARERDAVVEVWPVECDDVPIRRLRVRRGAEVYDASSRLVAEGSWLVDPDSARTDEFIIYS